MATEITEGTEGKESRAKKFFCVRVVNRFFSVSSVSSVANDSVRSDFRDLAAWPKKRKNARPKTDTRRQRENLFSSNVDRSRRCAEFFMSGGAVKSRAREESKTNAPRHFRRHGHFFARSHYRCEKLRPLMGANWPTFENLKIGQKKEIGGQRKESFAAQVAEATEQENR